jgi:hypothetical protein
MSAEVKEVKEKRKRTRRNYQRDLQDLQAEIKWHVAYCEMRIDVMKLFIDHPVNQLDVGRWQVAIDAYQDIHDRLVNGGRK